MEKVKSPGIRIQECEHHNPNKMPFGARYCPHCNTINLYFPHMRGNFEKIENDIIEILNHEIFHWLLCREISEEASMKFDAILSDEIFEWSEK